MSEKQFATLAVILQWYLIKDKRKLMCYVSMLCNNQAGITAHKVKGLCYLFHFNSVFVLRPFSSWIHGVVSFFLIVFK